MKKLVFALSFIIAIFAAFASNASKRTFLETAYTRNPDIANCIASSKQCNPSGIVPCNVSGKQGYRSGCVTPLFEP